MTDPNELIRQLAECLEDACDIIGGGLADEPETCGAWLAAAEQLLTAYHDHRRLQPSPGQPTCRNPLSAATAKPG